MPIASQVTVLIVDDQDSMRGLTRFMLKEMGILKIVEAADGLAALELLGKQRVDLVISDWNMQRMNGLELFKAIKAHPILKRLPVIMLTGNRSPEEVSAALAAGVRLYLTKPVAGTALKARIEAALGPLKAH